MLKMKSRIDFMFINGVAGDVSTRFTRRSQTCNEVIRLGALLADRIIDGMSSTQWKEIEDREIKVNKMQKAFCNNNNYCLLS